LAANGTPIGSHQVLKFRRGFSKSIAGSLRIRSEYAAGAHSAHGELIAEFALQWTTTDQPQAA
jgi:hypothetical protein